MSWPNRISFLRLLLIVPFILLLMNQRQWPPGRYVAIGIFVAMAFSDLLDGVLARRLNAKTRLGAILDPLADKLLIICSAIVLSLPHTSVPQAQLPDWIVVAIVGKDLWVIMGFIVIYLVTDNFCVRPSRAGKACTFGQILMVGFTLIAPDLNRLNTQATIGTWLSGGLCWAVACLCTLAVIGYTRFAISYIATEEKPLDDEAGKDNFRNVQN